MPRKLFKKSDPSDNPHLDNRAGGSNLKSSGQLFSDQTGTFRLNWMVVVVMLAVVGFSLLFISEIIGNNDTPDIDQISPQEDEQVIVNDPAISREQPEEEITVASTEMDAKLITTQLPTEVIEEDISDEEAIEEQSEEEIEEPLSLVPQLEECEKGLSDGFIAKADDGDDEGSYLQTMIVRHSQTLGEKMEIHMHRCIRDALQTLLDEYNEQPAVEYQLGGWGWRSNQRQIELRQKNCGTTNYDIYKKPASSCSPATARPGFASHQDGLAIDFYCHKDGLIRNNKSCEGAYEWLDCNAARFGLVNLPSEEWHWYYPIKKMELLEAKLQAPC